MHQSRCRSLALWRRFARVNPYLTDPVFASLISFVLKPTYTRRSTGYTRKAMFLSHGDRLKTVLSKKKFRRLRQTKALEGKTAVDELRKLKHRVVYNEVVPVLLAG